MTPANGATAKTTRVCSLDALVALIKHEAVDRYATNAHPLFVNCESYGSVTCYLSPDSGNYENRVTLYEAAATDVPGFCDSKWSLEEAMVALRSKFQHTDDVDYMACSGNWNLARCGSSPPGRRRPVWCGSCPTAV